MRTMELWQLMPVVVLALLAAKALVVTVPILCGLIWGLYAAFRAVLFWRQRWCRK